MNTCVSCFYYRCKDPAKFPQFAGRGLCGRHAPTIQGLPTVYEDDWCGEFRQTLPPCEEPAPPHLARS